MRNCEPKTQRKIVRAIADYIRRAAEEPDAVAHEQFIGGGAIGRVEAKLREYFSMPFCLVTNNATNAWTSLILAHADKLRGAEVIVPPQSSWGSTFAALKQVRCNLVTADSKRDGNIDPRSIERLVTPRTAAIIAVDFEGRPHDTFALRRISTHHKLLYLSDAAASFGAKFRRKPASSLADGLVISLGPRKATNCGEGGAVLVKDEATYARMLQLGHHPERYRREYSLTAHTEPQSVNCRIHPIAAIIAGELIPESST